MQDMTRHEASVCLHLRRGNTQLSEAQTVIDAQEEQIHQRRTDLAEQGPTARRGGSDSSSAFTGGVDPAAQKSQPPVGPAPAKDLTHQGHRSLLAVKLSDQDSAYHSAHSVGGSFDTRDLEGDYASQVAEEVIPVRKTDRGGVEPTVKLGVAAALPPQI